MKSIIEKLKLYQNEIFLITVIMLVGLISFGLRSFKRRKQNCGA